MILMTFALMTITATLTLYLASTPIILGLNILILALLLSTTFASFISSWFAFLVFLIYIGGMLVMFAYFLALTPNQQITNTNNFMYGMISIIILYLLSHMTNIKIPMITSLYQGSSILYLKTNTPFLIIMAMILLFTMIIVVKLSTRSSGPLRPFS